MNNKSPENRKNTKEQNPFFIDLSEMIVNIDLNEEDYTLTLTLDESTDIDEVISILEEDYKIFGTQTPDGKIVFERDMDINILLHALLGEDFRQLYLEDFKAPKRVITNVRAGGNTGEHGRTEDVYEEIDKSTFDFLKGVNVQIKDYELAHSRSDSWNISGNLLNNNKFRWRKGEYVNIKTGEVVETKQSINEKILAFQRSSDEKEKHKLAEQIIRVNMGLIIRQLNIFQMLYGFTATYNKSEAFQEALIQMYRAIHLYDPAKGSFSSYSILWVNQAIRRYRLFTRAPIHFPVYIQEKISKMLRLQREYIFYLSTDDVRVRGLSEDEYLAQAFGQTLQEYLSEKDKLMVYKKGAFSSAEYFGVLDEEKEKRYDEALRRLEHNLELDNVDDKKEEDAKQRVEDMIKRVAIDPKQEFVFRIRYGILPEEGYTIEQLQDFLSKTKNPEVKKFLNLDKQKIEEMRWFRGDLQEACTKVEKILMYILGYWDFEQMEEVNNSGSAVLSLDNIGEIFSFSRERARQIEAKAIGAIFSSKVIRDQEEVIAKQKRMVSLGKPLLGVTKFIEPGTKRAESLERRELKMLIASLATYGGMALSSANRTAFSLTGKYADLDVFINEMAGKNKEQDFVDYYQMESPQAFIEYLLNKFDANMVMEVVDRVNRFIKEDYKDIAPQISVDGENVIDGGAEAGLLGLNDQQKLAFEGLYFYELVTKDELRAFLHEFTGILYKKKDFSRLLLSVSDKMVEPTMNEQDFLDFMFLNFGVDLKNKDKGKSGKIFEISEKVSQEEITLFANLDLYTNLSLKDMVKFFAKLGYKIKLRTLKSMRNGEMSAVGTNISFEEFQSRFLEKYGKSLEKVVAEVMLKK